MLLCGAMVGACHFVIAAARRAGSIPAWCQFSERNIMFLSSQPRDIVVFDVVSLDMALHPQVRPFSQGGGGGGNGT